MNHLATHVERPFAVIGVDPGRKGALALVILRPQLELRWKRIDALPREPALFAYAVAELVKEWRDGVRLLRCAVEEPFGMHGQGDIMSYGRNFGQLEMALHLALPPGGEPVCVNPRTWQARLLPRKQGTTAKEFSMYVFNKLFAPTDPKALHEGVVDAALIAVSQAIAEHAMSRPAIDFSPFGIDPLHTTKKGTSDYGSKRRRKLKPIGEHNGSDLFDATKPASGDDKPIDVGF